MHVKWSKLVAPSLSEHNQLSLQRLQSFIASCYSFRFCNKMTTSRCGMCRLDEHTNKEVATQIVLIVEMLLCKGTPTNFRKIHQAYSAQMCRPSNIRNWHTSAIPSITRSPWISSRKRPTGPDRMVSIGVYLFLMITNCILKQHMYISCTSGGQNLIEMECVRGEAFFFSEGSRGGFTSLPPSYLCDTKDISEFKTSATNCSTF